MHPIGQTLEFFLVALPGLEDLVQAEVQAWFPNLQVAAASGGVAVMAPMAEGLAMNLVLKTPTRILVRVARFKCRDFPKLYRKISGLNWREWVDSGCEIDVHVASRASRLKIKKRIEETCIEAWNNQRKRLRPEKLGLYVRLQDDEVTLSLDTSGERLHKRGTRVHVGEAPLRETIAAAMLMMLERHRQSDRPVELVDPMMGSGTFLIEAAGLYRPSAVREFALDVFTHPPQVIPSAPENRISFSGFIGFEQDRKTIAAAKVNFSNAGLAPHILHQDFFRAEPLARAQNERWLISNPPYGERLKIKGEPREFYERLFATSERVANPDLACFLLPSKSVRGKFILPARWKVIEKRPFLNGGLPVTAFVFRTDR